MENKFSKYLIYALGEIVLVVIGILIALQINSWNAYQKDRKSEQLILKNFKDDLTKDRQLLEQFQTEAELRQKSIDTTLLMVNGLVDLNVISFVKNLENVITNIYFQSTSTTFDQSTSTGKIDLILNDALRSEILYYYKLTKLNFEDNRLLEINQDKIFPTILPMIIPTKSISHYMSGIAIKLPELDLESLATNADFNTWVIFKKTAYQRQSEYYSFLAKNVADLIAMIDGQLDD